MEVQSFTLADNISREGGRFDARGIFTFGFSFAANAFPVQSDIPFAMCLRRDNSDHEAAGNLRFRLRRRNGPVVDGPHNDIRAFLYPAEFRFCMVHGTIRFRFPEPGYYVLEITADIADAPTLYTYDMLIVAN